MQPPAIPNLVDPVLHGADAQFLREQLPPRRRHVGRDDLFRLQEPATDHAPRDRFRHVPRADDSEFVTHRWGLWEWSKAGQSEGRFIPAMK